VDDITHELFERSSRTLAAVDDATEVESTYDDLMPVVSPKATTGTATSGAFLVENWLVCEGES
jgi:hypothetical protein